MTDLISLRQMLHEQAELSCHEVETRKLLKHYLKEHCPSFEIVDFGTWFYAYKQGENSSKKIAIRADHDAIYNTQGQVFHGCGHDGHSTILVGLAQELEGLSLDNDLYLIFQHAEEIGLGAKEIVPTLKDLGIDYVYGLHNFPGFDYGKILGRQDTFMCASMGMEINLTGRQSHAGQPELGINPIFALADLINEIEVLADFKGFGPMSWSGHDFDGLVMVTPVSLDLGQEGAYGISPGRAKLQLTLRATYHKDLQNLIKQIQAKLEGLADSYRLSYQVQFCDEFPDTNNPSSEFDRLENVALELGLDFIELSQPFRPSEDFGWYLKEFPGQFFGLGSGLDTPSLHDDAYQFPDKIITSGIRIFKGLILSHESNKSS